jgi:glyoxylase-like metal-dependent hydrolase (beta-lactamase superfamily II)
MTRVRRIPVAVDSQVPTGKTNAYIIISTNTETRANTGSHPEAVLVDPPAQAPEIDAMADRVDITHILVTHTHPDHVGGVSTYADATGATVWCRRGRVQRFHNLTGVEPDQTFHEGTMLPVDESVRILDLPGHAPDHIGIETEAGILCGDIARAEGSVAITSPDGAMRAYFVTLRRLHARQPSRLYPGHGEIISHPRETCLRLLMHRQERESQVLTAIADGATSVESILEQAYDKDITDVRDLARATVRAHLEKLDAEGHIVFNREEAEIIDT